jgi:pantoate--beta-alanine ligase
MSPLEWILSIEGVRARVSAERKAGKSIALAPTMGALHEGHGALMEQARRESDVVLVSIFVNPIQFDRREDYEAYLVNAAEDREFCARHGADVVFAPSPEEMYPFPPRTFVNVEGVTDHLCGAFRPGHFRGVATVVAKLFHIVAPDRAYFGEKDAQQLAVIRRMVADLNMPVTIVPVATVREADGLAMSSRNRRLGPEERAAAPGLYGALQAARECVQQGSRNAAEVKAAAQAVLAAVPQFRLEYLEVVDSDSMTPVEEITGPVTIAVAAWLGSTRLIDNVPVR